MKKQKEAFDSQKEYMKTRKRWNAFYFTMGRGDNLLLHLDNFADFIKRKIFIPVNSILFLLLGITLIITIIDSVFEFPEPYADFLWMIAEDRYMVVSTVLFATIGIIVFRIILRIIITAGMCFGFFGILGTVASFLATGCKYADNCFTKHNSSLYYMDHPVLTKLRYIEWSDLFFFAMLGVILFFLIAIAQSIIYKIGSKLDRGLF